MDTELVVAGWVRIPDLMILGEDLAAVLLASGRSTITEDMPTPLLAVEVVSLSKANMELYCLTHILFNFFNFFTGCPRRDTSW